MLTINADGHAVMGRFHRPGDERRSLVVVPADNWQTWLSATTTHAASMFNAMDDSEFAAEAAPTKQAQTELL